MANDQGDHRFTAEEEAIFDSDGFLAYNIVHTPSVAANLSRPSLDHEHLFDFPIQQALRLRDSEDGGAMWMSRRALRSFRDSNDWMPRLHPATLRDIAAFATPSQTHNVPQAADAAVLDPVTDGDMTSTTARDETDHASQINASQISVPQTSASQRSGPQTDVRQTTIPPHLNMRSAINHSNHTDYMEFDPETAVAQSAAPDAAPPAGSSRVNGRLMPTNAAVQLGLIPVPTQDAAQNPSNSSQYSILGSQGLQTGLAIPNQGPTVPPHHGSSQLFLQPARSHQNLINPSEAAGGFERAEPAGTTWRNGMLVPSSFNTAGSSSAAVPQQHHQAVNQYGIFNPNQNGNQMNHLQGPSMLPVPQYYRGQPPAVHDRSSALMPPPRPQQLYVDQGESHGAADEPNTGSPRPNRRNRPAQSGTRRRRGTQPTSLTTEGDTEGDARQGEDANEENLNSSAKKRRRTPKKKSSAKTAANPSPKMTRFQLHNKKRMAQIKAGTAQTDTPFARQDYADLVAEGGHRPVTNIANFPLDHIFQYGQLPTAHLRRRNYDYSSLPSDADQNQEDADNEEAADEDVDGDADGDEEEGGDRDDESGGDEDAPGEDE